MEIEASAGGRGSTDQDYMHARGGGGPREVLSDIPAEPISDVDLRMPSLMRQERQYQRARKGVPPMCVPVSVFLWGEYEAMLEHMTYWPREYSGRRLGLVKAKPLLYLRIILLIFALGLLGWDLAIEFDVGLEGWFLVHVCYWAILVQVAYAATAVFVTHKACRVHFMQLSMPCIVKWPAKTAFALFHLAFPLSLLVLILFWVFPGRHINDARDEGAALQRGVSVLLSFLLLLVDALVTAQPMFLPLMPLLPLFATVYVIFSVIYWKAKGAAGAVWQPQVSQGGGYIFGVLEWENHSGRSAGWVTAVILVFCPLAFLLCWTVLGAWWRQRGGKARPGKDANAEGGDDHAMSDYSEHGLYQTGGQTASPGHDLRTNLNRASGGPAPAGASASASASANAHVSSSKLNLKGPGGGPPGQSRASDDGLSLGDPSAHGFRTASDHSHVQDEDLGDPSAHSQNLSQFGPGSDANLPGGGASSEGGASPNPAGARPPTREPTSTVETRASLDDRERFGQRDASAESEEAGPTDV